MAFRLLALALQTAPAAAADDPVRYAIDPTTLTLIGGIIVTIITTVVSGVISIITAIRVSHVATQQNANTSQLVTVAKETAVISGHVNSEKTAATGREAALQQENRLLREMLADKTATAAVLAQAATGRGASRSTDPPAGVPLPVEVVNTAPVPVAPVAAESTK